MDKDKNKGLADNGEGEFILNESGTSVTIDSDEVYPEDKDQTKNPAQTNNSRKDEADDAKENLSDKAAAAGFITGMSNKKD